MKHKLNSLTIPGEACTYLIVHDPCHGPKENRYTVYQIPLHPSGRVKIIGRELPLSRAKDYVKEYESTQTEEYFY